LQLDLFTGGAKDRLRARARQRRPDSSPEAQRPDRLKLPAAVDLYERALANRMKADACAHRRHFLYWLQTKTRPSGIGVAMLHPYKIDEHVRFGRAGVDPHALAGAHG
jgi:hypothetical protein